MLLLLSAPPAWAQFETASVVGLVKDAQSGAITGTKVTLTNTESGVSVEKISDKKGQFEFLTVKPGLYSLTDFPDIAAGVIKRR